MIRTEQIGVVRMFRPARTLLGRPLYFTAAYLVDGLLIDTGCAHTADELLKLLSGTRIELIVNTHSHEDHVGANAALQSRSGADILAHPLALPYLADPRKRCLHPYQRIVWGYAAPSTAGPLGDFVETDHHTFRVIHTPGHSPDHVSLYDPDEGLLFSGDAYVGGRDRSLRQDYNVWEIIASLKKLAALDVKTLFPGSGTIRHNPRDDLNRKIEYLEEMGRRVLELYDGGMSYRRIRRELFGPEMSITYYTLGHFSGWNLVRSYVEDRPSE